MQKVTGFVKKKPHLLFNLKLWQFKLNSIRLLLNDKFKNYLIGYTISVTVTSHQKKQPKLVADKLPIASVLGNPISDSVK